MSGNYDVGVLPMSEFRLPGLSRVSWRSCWQQFGRGNSLQTDCSVYICHAQHVAHHNHLAAGGGMPNSRTRLDDQKADHQESSRTCWESWDDQKALELLSSPMARILDDLNLTTWAPASAGMTTRIWRALNTLKLRAYNIIRVLNIIKLKLYNIIYL
jgi:hypothetical protein